LGFLAGLGPPLYNNHLHFWLIWKYYSPAFMKECVRILILPVEGRSIAFADFGKQLA
jgi:hypothetical protein